MTTQTIVDTVTLSAASWANDVDTVAYSPLTGVAGTNTITATGPANYTTASRIPLSFIPAATNTGATTLNVTPSGGAAIGAKAVFANGAACVGGEMVIGVPCQVIYDGTQFHLLSLADLKATTASTFTFDGGGGTTGSLSLVAEKRGLFVKLQIPAALGTSGTGSTVLASNTALPVAFRPTANQACPANNINNNGAAAAGAGLIAILTSGIIQISRDNTAAAYANGTTCGLNTPVTVTYYVG